MARKNEVSKISKSQNQVAVVITPNPLIGNVLVRNNERSRNKWRKTQLCSSSKIDADKNRRRQNESASSRPSTLLQPTGTVSHRPVLGKAYSYYIFTEHVERDEEQHQTCMRLAAPSQQLLLHSRNFCFCCRKKHMPSRGGKHDGCANSH